MKSKFQNNERIFLRTVNRPPLTVLADGPKLDDLLTTLLKIQVKIKGLEFINHSLYMEFKEIHCILNFFEKKNVNKKKLLQKKCELKIALVKKKSE